MSRFRLLGINLLVVDGVFSGGHHLVNGLWCFEHDKRETSRSAGVGVSLQVDALNFAIRAKVVT